VEASVITKLSLRMNTYIRSTIALPLVALALEGCCVPMRGENQPARPGTRINFGEVVRQAEAARIANKFEEAARLYRMAVRARPNWKEGWGYLASSLYQLNRFVEARDAYRQTTVLTPKNAPSWAFLGLCEYELAEYRHAFDHLFKSEQLGLDADEDLIAQVKYHLAILWTTAGQFELGLQEISWFPKQNLGSPEILEVIGLSVLHLAWFPNEIPADKHELVLNAGAAGFAENSRQMEKARALYDQLVDEYPKEHNVRYARGRFLVALDPDAALKDYQSEIEISPRNVPARIQAGYLNLKMGQLDQGLKYVREALQLESKNPMAHNLLGRILEEKGQNKDAIPELVLATKLAPNHAEFHLNLARAYQKAGETTLAQKEIATFNELEKQKAEQQPTAPPPNPK
jgi:tetratricopeptide (TPR) repeat protein